MRVPRTPRALPPVTSRPNREQAPSVLLARRVAGGAARHRKESAAFVQGGLRGTGPHRPRSFRITADRPADQPPVNRRSTERLRRCGRRGGHRLHRSTHHRRGEDRLAAAATGLAPHGHGVQSSVGGATRGTAATPAPICALWPAHWRTGRPADRCVGFAAPTAWRAKLHERGAAAVGATEATAAAWRGRQAGHHQRQTHDASHHAHSIAGGPGRPGTGASSPTTPPQP